MIQVGFEETPPNGEICSVCKQVIQDIVVTPFIQVGGPEEVKYLDIRYCEKCYSEKFTE